MSGQSLTPGVGTETLPPGTPEPGDVFGFRDLVRDRATAFKFTAILGLQMGQVFPAAFFGLMLTAIYRQNGLPLDMFWVFAIPSIPTWIRPLWAPLVDGVGSARLGLRRTWFIPCTIFGALTYASLAAFAPTLEDLWLIITILTVKSTIMTTQDIAIDGYMVENLAENERGVGAALMDIGRNVAMFASWAGVAAVYQAYGWDAAVQTAAALLVAFSLPGILRREPPPPPHAVAARARGERPSLLVLLKRPDARLAIPLIMLAAFGSGLITQLYIPFLVDQGFTVGDIGIRILAPATLVGTVLGATITVGFLNRFGYRPTILFAAFLMIPTVVPIMWMGQLEQPSLMIVFLVTLNGIFLPSFMQVAMAGARLKWASRAQAATDYTTQIVAMSAASNLGLAIGGVLAEHLGWFWYFALAGAVVVVSCFTVWLLFERVETLVETRDAEELARRGTLA
jgi:MFS family permease